MNDSSTGRVVLRRLGFRNFRNLEQASFEPASRFNLVFGDNGHGKTSLIEALYVLCTTKSFRSARLGETIRQDEQSAELRAQVECLGLKRELSATLGARTRTFLIDGKRSAKNVEYALKTPVIAFHPGDLTLCSGPATQRRTLLDRVMLHQDPGGAEARLAYLSAVRDRQKLLVERGVRARELDAYEQVIADRGARFAQGRRHAAQTVIEALGPAFVQMAPADVVCDAMYVPGGSSDASDFVAELARRRPRDLSRGAATYGPHRDELSLMVDGRPARSHASQGQQRLLTLSLKMAELLCIREVTGMQPLLLLDDVSSELDPERQHAVFELLRQSESQIFVTTTRPELFSEVLMDPEDRADFRVKNGVLSKSLK